MKLKAVLDSLDGLDEAVAKLYKKGEDGKFRLEVEGVVDKSKLDEFRDNNIQLKAQLDEMKKRLDSFSGIDPAKYKELNDKMTSMEEKKLLADGKLEEVIQLRISGVKRDFEEQLKIKTEQLSTLEKERNAAFKERDTFVIDAELRRAIDSPDFGFQAGVGDLLKRQVLDEFQFKEGKVVRVKPDGSIVYGKNGDPATIGEFLHDVAKDRPYLVKESKGGGAQNNGKAGTGAKTMKRADFDALDPIAKSTQLKAGLEVVD